MKLLKACSQFSSRLMVRYGGLFLALSLLGVAIQSQWEVARRLRLGYGLTDEAFSINMAFARQAMGNDAWVWPFSIPLSWLASVSSGSVFQFRLVGFGVSLLVMALLFTSVAKLRKKDLEETKTLQALVLIGAALTIQSTFAYLLTTPTYQWAIQQGLLLLISALAIGERSLRGWLSWLPHFLSGFAIYILALSRPTGGVIALLLYSVYMFSEKRRSAAGFVMRTISISAVLLAFTFAIFPSLIRDLKLSVRWALTLNPHGYSIYSECLDVTTTYLYIVVIFLAANLTYRLSQSVGEKKHLALLLSVVSGLGLAAIASQFGLFIYSGIFIACAGSLAGALAKRPNMSAIVIGALPIFSQFGSAMPTIITVADNLISAALLLCFSPVVRANRSDKPVPGAFVLALGCLIAVSAIVHAEQSYSFEKTIGAQALALDQRSGLFYSKAKLKAINEWRRHARAYVSRGDFVGDLSYWHPGLINYLNAWPLEQSPGDFTYRRTYELQAKNYFNDSSPSHREQTRTFVIAAPKGITQTSTTCAPLSKFISDKSLKRGLSTTWLALSVKVVSKYSSQPEDGTLYPKDAYLLAHCK